MPFCPLRGAHFENATGRPDCFAEFHFDFALCAGVDGTSSSAQRNGVLGDGYLRKMRPAQKPYVNVRSHSGLAACLNQ